MKRHKHYRKHIKNIKMETTSPAILKDVAGNDPKHPFKRLNEHRYDERKSSFNAAP